MNTCAMLSIVSWLFCLGSTAPQTPSEQRAEWVSHLRAVVDAELAFARTSEQKGTQDAFLEFLGEDSVLFRPQPVPGRKAYLDRPASPGRLSWRPVFADVSAAGDLGYTTGPYEFRKDAADAMPASYGNYFTIWKRQPDGVWKVLIDYGTTNPAPPNPPPAFDPSASRYEAVRASNEGALKTAAALAELDRRMSDVVGAKGVSALKKSLGEFIRILRPGIQPAVGIDAAMDLLLAESGSSRWTPEKSGASASGDLGYVYGKLERRPKAAGGSVRTGYYLRVYRRTASGAWKIAAEVANYS